MTKLFNYDIIKKPVSDEQSAMQALAFDARK